MTVEKPGWIPSRFARLSTGLKMLLFLSLGLLPLGLIAILATVQSAQENRAKRQEGAIARLEMKAQRVDAALSRIAITVRAASSAIALTPAESGVCRTTLLRLERGQSFPARFALFESGGRLRCASAGYQPPPLPARARGIRSRVEISPDGQSLRLVLFDERGAPEGIGEFSRSGLSDLTYIPGTTTDFDLELVQGGRRMLLRDDYVDGGLVETVHGVAPVAGGRLQLRITLGAAPLRAPEVLMILLPVLMWLFAALIGWLIVDRLLLRPLVRMERVISAYRPGDRHVDIPTVATPAREIGDLGRAFDQVARTVARHEADLEAAIERQTRLVREVHHRVKNNLQVVASLLNLHSRGSANEEVAAAYASIQRRVDALAVVHRNHYAELEENRGVALKPLISELGANLRATAPASASDMAISLQLEPLYVTQDVAVSVAFLITELVEFAMLCGADQVAISLTTRKGGSGARLTVTSDSLKGDTNCDPQLFERFDRIVTGLSRQLRSAMERDLEKGRYSVKIPISSREEQS